MKINKEIVEGFYNTKGVDEKYIIYISKQKEEISVLTKANSNIKRDNDNIKSKMLYYEQSISDSVFEYREKIEIYEAKVFMLQNENEKNKIIITQLKDKLGKIYERKRTRRF